MQGFARATSYIPTEVSFTTTGNIDNLDFTGADLIRMNNATDATIRGLVAGTAGQRVTIVSIGAGHVYFAHQNTNSTAANRLINSVTNASTPLAAGSGSATYQYDGTTGRWRLIQHHQGDWIPGTYAAGDFTALVGNWTVGSGDTESSHTAYYLTGRMLTLAIDITTSDVSAATAELYVKIPGGFTVAAQTTNAGAFVSNAGTFGTGRMVATVSGTIIKCRPVNLVDWAATAGANTYVQGQIPFEVN